MADRILTWFFERSTDNVPAFYLEDDYEISAIRLRAETAPKDADATFNIYDDGVSIFADRATSQINSVNLETHVPNRYTPNTTILLCKGDTEELEAEDLRENLHIDKGSWITCDLVNDGGGKNFTVQMELDYELEREDDIDPVRD